MKEFDCLLVEADDENSGLESILSEDSYYDEDVIMPMGEPTCLGAIRTESEIKEQLEDWYRGFGSGNLYGMLLQDSSGDRDRNVNFDTGRGEAPQQTT